MVDQLSCTVPPGHVGENRPDMDHKVVVVIHGAPYRSHWSQALVSHLLGVGGGISEQRSGLSGRLITLRGAPGAHS